MENSTTLNVVPPEGQAGTTKKSLTLPVPKRTHTPTVNWGEHYVEEWEFMVQELSTSDASYAQPNMPPMLSPQSSTSACSSLCPHVAIGIAPTPLSTRINASCQVNSRVSSPASTPHSGCASSVLASRACVQAATSPSQGGSSWGRASPVCSPSPVSLWVGAPACCVVYLGTPAGRTQACSPYSLAFDSASPSPCGSEVFWSALAVPPVGTDDEPSPVDVVASDSLSNRGSVCLTAQATTKPKGLIAV